MRVRCKVDDCVHNKEGFGCYEHDEKGCELDQIDIHYGQNSGGFFVACMDFEEKQDD